METLPCEDILTMTQTIIKCVCLCVVNVFVCIFALHFPPKDILFLLGLFFIIISSRNGSKK